jgi:hypothetical protein
MESQQTTGVLMTNGYEDHLSDEELAALCKKRLPGEVVMNDRYWPLASA